MLELEVVLWIAAGAFLLGMTLGFSIRAYVSARRHRRAVREGLTVLCPPLRQGSRLPEVVRNKHKSNAR